MVEPPWVGRPWPCCTRRGRYPSGRRPCRSRTTRSPPRSRRSASTGGSRDGHDLAVHLTARRDHLAAVCPVVDVVLRLAPPCSGPACSPWRCRCRRPPSGLPKKPRAVPGDELPGRHPALPAVLVRPRVVDEPLVRRPPRPCPQRAAAGSTSRRPGRLPPSGAARASARRWPTAWPWRCVRTGRRGDARAGRRLRWRPRAALRPGTLLGWPRRAAARPPPCGCGGLRRCSLIERLLLGQARRLEAAVEFRSPRCPAAQTTHGQNPPSAEVHPKSGNLPPTNW